MSKQKKSTDHLISELQEDWRQLDDLYSPSSLPVHALKEQLEIVKINKRRAFYKELCFFILLALFILTIFTTLMFQAPFIFLRTQVAIVIIAPIIFLLLTKRKTKGSIPS